MSAVIAVLYDAAIDSAKWSTALKSVCDYVGGAQATMFWQGAAADNVGVLHLYNDDPVYTRLYLEKLAPLNPAFPAVLFQEVGAVHAFSDLVPEQELEETAFHREWIAPQGFTDSLAVLLERDATRMAFLSFPWRGGQIDAAARERLALLVPHIQRAVTIAQLFGRQNAEASLLTETLDQVGEPVFLLSSDRRIVYANASGREMIDRGVGIRLQDKRLRAAADEADHALADSLDAITRGAPVGAQGTSFALESTPNDRLLATLLPLKREARQRVGTADLATAALFVRRSRFADPTPLELVAKRYGLTASEIRVVEATLRVSGLDALAGTLGVSKATVKTHLNRIYRKCPVKNQSELIKLVAGLVQAL
ncbi:helix-turn-helix transcriptional regulator [Methylobacterium brachythecii]|nr:LuxR C-terminal-related transcriptional regulator [Methylobacterium brachythecii]MBB3904786.1 DNA-binding CsgD family transcriptional regulator/PAS domain-containing protein [Methylobacterium brachythecii]